MDRSIIGMGGEPGGAGGVAAARMSCCPAVLSRAQRWEEMPQRIDDEVLGLFATVGTWDEIVPRLMARYAGLVTHAEFSIPAPDRASEAVLAKMVEALRAG